MRNRRLLCLTVFGNILFVGFFWIRRHHLVAELNSISRDSDLLEKSNKHLFESLENASRINSFVVKRLQSHYGRLKDLTEFTRNKFIRIKGVPEKDGEDLEDKVIELAEYMGISVKITDINRVNRIGVKKGSIPRIIVAELTSFKLKSRLLKQAASSLRNTPFVLQDDATNVALSPGLSPMEKPEFTPGCGYITAVSAPVTHAKAKKLFGAWLQDPIPSTDGMWDNYIWVLPHFFQNNIVEEYVNLHELSHRRSKKVYELPYEWAGTGHVVYNRTLYFTKFNTSTMVRYDFASSKVLTERRLQGAAFGNKAPYQWSGSTDIDFSTDEYGLWVIYGTSENTYDIVLSRVDPVSLEVVQTWRTNWRKQWSGNAFMLCGVLYVLKKYDEKSTSLSYTYDTRTKRYKRIDVSFSNKYEWNSMLEYNFRKKQLYAWDRGYIVTYNVTLSP